MKKLFLVSLLASLLVFGCHRNVAKPTGQCVPLSQYNKIVIADFRTDRTIITENEPWSTPESIKNTARLITEGLKNKLEEQRKFNQVVVSNECIPGALRIAGEIDTFFHKKRRFHATVKGEFIDCQTGVSLYKFGWLEAGNTLPALPERIANRLRDAVSMQLVCEKMP